MLTVATVLRTGPEYRPYHVQTLRDGVAKYLTIPFRFVCLTDYPFHQIGAGMELIPLKHGWPGWWSKIELFAKGVLEGPVLYLDLDTIPCGSLDEIALGHRFTMLQNFWRADRVGSGVMAWRIDMSQIYEAFKLAPQFHMAEFNDANKWGDQAFILKHAPMDPERFQTKFPDRIVSYKMHCRPGMDPKNPTPGETRVPEGASLICFHGQPRPWTTPLWKAFL